MSSIVLRLASLLTLLQYSAHAYLFLSRASDRGMLFGYGLMAILSGMVAFILLWLLASLAKAEPLRTRPFIVLMICANLVHAYLVWKYFGIPIASAFDIAIALILVLALALTGSGLREEPIRP